MALGAQQTRAGDALIKFIQKVFFQENIEIIFVSLNFYIIVGKGRPKGRNRIEWEVFEMAQS